MILYNLLEIKVLIVCFKRKPGRGGRKVTVWKAQMPQNGLQMAQGREKMLSGMYMPEWSNRAVERISERFLCKMAPCKEVAVPFFA